MIYMDNAATSHPKAPGVVAAVARALEAPFGNAGRPSSLQGLAAGRVLFETREALAGLLGLQDSSRIAFTKNATEAINTIILGAVPPGGTLAVSTMEHNAVARPACYLEKERGVRLIRFDVDERGRPDPQSLREAMDTKPDLLVVTAASNVTGALLPFGEIVQACRARGIRSLVDGSQGVGHIQMDMGALRPTAFCFPGHKGLLGPDGTGGFWTEEGFDPPPLITGGTGSDSANTLQPVVRPDRYEAGTQNGSALAGLLAALRFLSSAGLADVERREAELRERLVQGLKEIPDLRVHGPVPEDRAVPVVSVSSPSVDVATLAEGLGKRGIAIRPGLHCAPWAHEVLGTIDTGGTLRLSPGYFTEDQEIDSAVEALKELIHG